MEEQERVIELEATHLSQLQLASRQFNDLLDVLPLGGDQERLATVFIQIVLLSYFDVC